MNTESLLEVASHFKGILLDAYGVFWSGNLSGLLAGADKAMQELVEQGKVVGVLSNATRLGEREVEKLKKHNLEMGKHFHFFITSGDITRQILLSNALPFATTGKKFYVLGGPYPHGALHDEIFANTSYEETVDLSQADFIYASTPQINGKDQTDPSVFKEEIERCFRAKLPMLCSNPDLFAHEGSPGIAVVRQGSIAKMYERLGGKVYYIGKPYQDAYEKALSHFDSMGITSPSDILMIGDTPETDVRGSKAYGLRAALLLGTGIMAERIESRGLENSLLELSQEDTPHYFLERLKV